MYDVELCLAYQDAKLELESQKQCELINSIGFVKKKKKPYKSKMGFFDGLRGRRKDLFMSMSSIKGIEKYARIAMGIPTFIKEAIKNAIKI